ncbi:MAG: AmmeMemoRadiSam system protein B [Phycisphaerales bacterium]|nr:AmmeMemoRadiSam system protein B [Phycisphaerales bacterium]
MPSDSVPTRLPAMRPVNATPFHSDGGQLFFALHDYSGIAAGPLAVTAAGYFVLAHLDGNRTHADVRAAVKRQFDAEISHEQIDALIESLDDALLLHTERYENAYALREQQYRRAAARDNRARWPVEHALRSEILSLIAEGVATPVGDLRGFIAPHLDYARGRPCYADAYATLIAASPADRYVILGTNHYGRCRSVVATGKDFLTPLGLVATDLAFIEQLEARLGQSIRRHEMDHAAEHSIELQTHLLQTAQPHRKFSVVPVLCPDPTGPSGAAPRDGIGPDLLDFADALAELIDNSAGRTVVIASADLSHVGTHFGDAARVTPECMIELEASDRRLLDLCALRREDEFVAAVRANDNETGICSIGCIYAMLRALPGMKCRITRYHQATNYPADTHVTCAAGIVFRE